MTNKEVKEIKQELQELLQREPTVLELNQIVQIIRQNNTYSYFTFDGVEMYCSINKGVPKLGLIDNDCLVPASSYLTKEQIKKVEEILDKKYKEVLLGEFYWAPNDQYTYRKNNRQGKIEGILGTFE